jgi:predicted phosphoadenosine phosphosulfate sulfurtransferase
VGRFGQSTTKRGLKIDVLTAARERVRRVFDDFGRIYVSFSGGKDSGVLTELACQEARARGRRIGVLIVDLEAQYKQTIDYVHQMLDRHADVADPYWVALPLNLRNAVSHFEPQWMCWDPAREPDWVRRPPPGAITDEAFFPFFRRGMEFEEFVPAFAEWYGDGTHLTACLVGIRADESLNRWRTICRRDKRTYEGLRWTTFIPPCAYNAYPIYDWRTEDIWTYYSREKVLYNRLYDRMHQAGLSIHQARICQPYGDDQRRGLWLYSVIEPETWARVVARVNGANFGAAHAGKSGNILGNIKVTKPDHLTWQQFAVVLLDSMPPGVAEHYRNKIAVFLRYYQERGIDPIPDEGPPNQKGAPSWTRICKMLLRFDYHAKGLSFSPNKPDAYKRYQQRMKKRREEWQLI